MFQHYLFMGHTLSSQPPHGSQCYRFSLTFAHSWEKMKSKILGSCDLRLLRRVGTSDAMSLRYADMSLPDLLCRTSFELFFDHLKAMFLLIWTIIRLIWTICFAHLNYFFGSFDLFFVAHLNYFFAHFNYFCPHFNYFFLLILTIFCSFELFFCSF